MMQENHKILVVDDDMRLRGLLERYLTEQGFQVRGVANAEQMDRLLTRESFHLMVLDLMLPGKTAFLSVGACAAKATLSRSLW